MSTKHSTRFVKTASTDCVIETTMICDCCGKESYDNGEVKFGGWVHSGFISVNKRVSLVSQIAGTRTDWDFCSEECMVKYFDIGGCC